MIFFFFSRPGSRWMEMQIGHHIKFYTCPASSVCVCPVNILWLVPTCFGSLGSRAAHYLNDSSTTYDVTIHQKKRKRKRSIKSRKSNASEGSFGLGNKRNDLRKETPSFFFFFIHLAIRYGTTRLTNSKKKTNTNEF